MTCVFEAVGSHHCLVAAAPAAPRPVTSTPTLAPPVSGEGPFHAGARLQGRHAHSGQEKDTE